MNAYLTAAGLTRIIVPTVLREDYLMALRALSQNGEPAAYARVLIRCAQFSRWLNFRNLDECLRQLNASGALRRAGEAVLRF